MDTRAAAPCGIWLLVPDTLSMLGEHAEAPVHDPEETQGVTTPSISMPFGRMQCSAAAHHRSLLGLPGHTDLLLCLCSLLSLHSQFVARKFCS